MDQPKTVALPLACGACETWWELRVTLPMPVQDFANSMGAERCPKCRSGDVALVCDDDENAVF